ncbi:sulfotransferase domain-containing protein [Bowmanella denitrificans]
MSVVFVLSTGRCGTQWLHQFLNSRLPDSWEASHEPINFDYAPTDNSPSQPLNKNPQKLLNHLAYIQNRVKNHQSYVECGFPCWRHLGWFSEELDCPVKIIYLHRDPVQVSRSWLKQNAFVQPILPHLGIKELFHPAAPEAQLTHYQNSWRGLTSFEKGLYYWAEVQAQAARYKTVWSTENWFELPFHQLTDQCVLQDLMGFLDTDVEIGNIDAVPRDRFQGIEQDVVDETLIRRHPDILQEAEKLGYSSYFS